MFHKIAATAVLLLGVAAAPAMAQPAVQFTAPIGHHGFISVGAGAVQPVYYNNYYRPYSHYYRYHGAPYFYRGGHAHYWHR